MSIFPGTPGLRTRVLPRFPANVIAGTGIVVTKSGGTYTFSTTAIVGLPLASLESIAANRLVGRDVGAGSPVPLTVAGGLGFTGSGGLQLLTNQRLRTLVFQATIAAGIKGDIVVPFACTIQTVTLLADAAMATNPFILEIWKDSYANYPPVVGDSIVGTNKPTIAVGQLKSQMTTFTGWSTVAIAAGDTLRFNVVAPAAATATRVAVCIDALTL